MACRGKCIRPGVLRPASWSVGRCHGRQPMGSSIIKGSDGGWRMSMFDERRNGVDSVAAVVIRLGVKVGAQQQQLPFTPLPEGYNSSTGTGDEQVLFSSTLRHVRLGD